MWSQDILNELTVVSLKEVARQVGKSTAGTKAELMSRILSVEEDAWRGAVGRLTDDNSLQGLTSPKSTMRMTEQRARPNEEAAISHVAPSELMKRELEILKREKALLERELSLTRRELGKTLYWPSIGPFHFYSYR
ncbi:hypothetical protein ALC62_15368 [Cyphomyrmex costatus]|uniref:SAP domain-containing protein n=1 Tax=Cyphomyrmex costatus TaxID=456900 RepID=A0A151I7C3_9HYME|nr:hypothetical protein ALC62_15368 [Cyphomyrmex costatus]